MLAAGFPSMRYVVQMSCFQRDFHVPAITRKEAAALPAIGAGSFLFGESWRENAGIFSFLIQLPVLFALFVHIILSNQIVSDHFSAVIEATDRW